MMPRIETSHDRKLIGQRVKTSLAINKTSELWKGFQATRSEITNRLTNDLISMQIYKPDHFADFRPANEFEKWAAVEVADFNNDQARWRRSR